MYTVLGLGYVGMTMAACLAERNFKAIGVDIDVEKVSLVKSGRSPIHEPGLEEIISRTIKSGSLSVTDDIKEAVENSRVTFVTVGTPSIPDGSIDLKQIKDVAASIGEALKKIDKYHLVVVRSTIIPGTAERVVKPILERASGKTCGKDFGLCVNPEFLSEGSAVHDMLEPDRLIIGEYDETSGEILEGLYERFYAGSMPRIMRTSLANAELIKYANNSFLATKISFINSIARLCEKLSGADVKIIAEGMGLDQRISHLFLNAGLGWGGSCFPKDVKAILQFARTIDIDLPIIDVAIQTNELQSKWAVEKVETSLGTIRGKCIAILGLAFKPNTDDIREAVSIKIIDQLLEKGASIRAYDPKAMNNARKIFGEKIFLAQSATDCINNAECCILVTEWDEFRKLHPDDFRKNMRRPFVIDGRRIYDQKEFSENMEYHGIGIGKD